MYIYICISIHVHVCIYTCTRICAYNNMHIHIFLGLLVVVNFFIVENKFYYINENFKENYCKHVLCNFAHRLISDFPGKLFY